MHILIPFWNKCNNRCIMCTNPVVEPQKQEGVCFEAMSLSEFIESRKKKWREMETIYLTGGEPTIRPDFFDSLRYISKSFPLAQITVLSNGRRFFYPDFAKKYLAFSTVNLTIPIHGWNSWSHDAVTGIKGSFKQTVGGLKNIFAFRRPGQQVEIRVIIHKINYKNLPKIFDFLLKEFSSADRVVIVFLEYEGHAIENFKVVELSYKEFRPQFKLIEKYLTKFEELRFYHFPLCALPQKFWPHMWRTLDEDEVSFMPKCAKCTVKNFCMGVHKNYLQFFDTREFIPVRKAGNINPTGNEFHPLSFPKV